MPWLRNAFEFRQTGEMSRPSWPTTPQTRSLIQMLPITIDMRDHMRQEKTGNLPSPLPEIARQRDFAVGTLGLWGPDHFVIYYRSGRVPQPGIVDSRQRDWRCLDL